MINVVFLLLIFFLMSATLAPTPALDVTPGTAEAEVAPPVEGVLLIDAEGAMAYGAITGEAVFPAIASRGGEDPLPIRADARLPAVTLARILGELSEVGVEAVTLLAVRS